MNLKSLFLTFVLEAAEPKCTEWEDSGRPKCSKLFTSDFFTNVV